MDRVERVARALAMNQAMEAYGELDQSDSSLSELPTDADFDENLAPEEQDEWRGVARIAIAAAADEGPRAGSIEAMEHGAIFGAWCRYRETLKQDDPYGDWPSFVAGAQARLKARTGQEWFIRATADTHPVTVNGEVFDQVFNLRDIEIVLDPTLKPGTWLLEQRLKVHRRGKFPYRGISDGGPIKFWVGRVEHETTASHATYEEVLAWAGKFDGATVVWMGKHGHGTLISGESAELVDGMRFSVHHTNNA